MSTGAANPTAQRQPPTRSSPYGTRKKARKPYIDDGSDADKAQASIKHQNNKKRQSASSLTSLTQDRRKSRRKKSFAPALVTSSAAEVDGARPTFSLQLFDGSTVKVDECVYLVCEPPGEPYYLARIMEFCKLNQESTEINAVRVNWFYRPRDIMRQNSDSRLIFATMHSDISPLSAIRGKCYIQHKSQISDHESFRAQPDSFYYDRLFDKFIHRYYEVIPVEQVQNVPEKVRARLVQRWKFVIVEINRGKELAMEHRACKRCGDWCSSKESVRCAICNSDFHMACVQPPLPKKPSRGFAWSCSACSRAEARRIEAARIPDVVQAGGLEKWQSQHRDRQRALDQMSQHSDMDEDEEDADEAYTMEGPERQTLALDPAHSGPLQVSVTPSASDERKGQPEQWPFRYLGIHCNVNDVLDYDDRIYPRAASRLGPRHQAVVADWPGQAIQYFEKTKRVIKKSAKAKAAANRRTGAESNDSVAIPSFGEAQPELEGNPDTALRGTNAGALLISALKTEEIPPASDHVLETDGDVEMKAEETRSRLDYASLSAASRPPWVQEAPAGYLARGEGKTSERLWVNPSESMSQEVDPHFINDYLEDAATYADKLKVSFTSPNWLDAALKALCHQMFDRQRALHSLSKLTRKSIGEPTFSAEEKARFAQGVSKFGSELREVSQFVKTKNTFECVRYYYNWKKTEEGREVWGHFEGRRPKGENKTGTTPAKSTSSSTSPSKPRVLSQLAETDQLIADSSDDSAFDSEKASKLKKSFSCKFCSAHKSKRWRRAPGTHTSKTAITALCNRCADLWRKYAVHWESPEEVYRKLNEGGARGKKRKLEAELVKEQPANGEKPEVLLSDDLSISKPPNKKGKKSAANGHVNGNSDGEKVRKEKAARLVSPILPDPCAVCLFRDLQAYATCSRCELHVHKTCYGIPDAASPPNTANQQHSSPWLCDICINQKSPIVSTIYNCVLCPVKEPVEERCKGPLKRTSGNNWVHILCAVWTPELRFGDATTFQPVEGIGALPLVHWEQVCVLCKTTDGACVTCSTCSVPMHVGCAWKAGYTLGFDVQPIKQSQSRREAIAIVKLGQEEGFLTPVIHCPAHDLRRLTVHPIHEIAPGNSSQSALELFVKTYKSSTAPLSRTSKKGLLRTFTGNVNPIVIALKSEELRKNKVIPIQKEKSATAPFTPRQNSFCRKCGVAESPYWYPLNPDAAAVNKNRICHKCYFRIEAANKQAQEQKQAAATTAAEENVEEEGRGVVSTSTNVLESTRLPATEIKSLKSVQGSEKVSEDSTDTSKLIGTDGTTASAILNGIAQNGTLLSSSNNSIQNSSINGHTINENNGTVPSLNTT